MKKILSITMACTLATTLLCQAAGAKENKCQFCLDTTNVESCTSLQKKISDILKNCTNLCVSFDKEDLLEKIYCGNISDIFDNIIGTPAEPEEPDVPNAPAEPEVPEVPVEPETPEAPVEPETPEVPVEPETPEVPTEPEMPDIPELPSQPEVDNPELDDTVTGNYQFSEYIRQVVNLVNKERAKIGLSALTSDSASLMNAANVRAKEQSELFSHTRPDGRSWESVLSQYGIPYRSAGENVAFGQSTPIEVVGAWMNSEGHRANILSGNFSKIGVGVYRKGSTYYWSQLFTD